mmetsp:Transcript_8209/g.21182  ORF Transcript_8209/g.21182 Transcript_8209/m.21182 type:complete len:179 (-) Transcript_8209:253-789(-)|eukprot:CAMPEP_0119406428 /NCGR_PEP_ID=MMETSP1335-20130426/754_1 /TAXON_ID=259385 /ORGANISM="Chrysoculter rhomboideus, Strain RCC1486" /LENGTH=178 /DNA_ID=CAMNT_0007430507 /DNA_START=21 /DNA_END=557 /DNA_ORIENTATION=+
MGACRDLAMLLVASAAASAAVSASAVARAPGRTLSAFSPAHVRHLSPRTPRAAVALADVISGTEQDMLHITEPAMAQLLSLKAKESAGKEMVLRMGVRSGGCSGMSYVMDMISADEIDENDLVIEYAEEGLRCVVDPKSSMFLYGLQLTYSDALIGGGFGFKNPNAESTCGCGSSFSV